MSRRAAQRGVPVGGMWIVTLLLIVAYLIVVLAKNQCK
jgi:hypothetical protein